MQRGLALLVLFLVALCYGWGQLPARNPRAWWSPAPPAGRDPHSHGHRLPAPVHGCAAPDPAYAAIRCLACRGALEGYCDGTFRPQAALVRGALAQWIAQAADFNDVIPSSQQTFTDVPPGSYYWLYVERMTLPGRQYMTGYTTSPPCLPGQVPCFVPEATVTRGQAAKSLANAAGYSDAIPSIQQTYTDVPYSNPFWIYIERATLHGAVSGYTSSPPCNPGGVPCFLPNNNLLRGDAARWVADAFIPNCQTPHAGSTTFAPPACEPEGPSPTPTLTPPGGSPTRTPTLAASPSPTDCPLYFFDVPPDGPFYPYVRCLACRGIISGYTASPPCDPGGVPCFQPAANVTRSQVAKIISNAAGFTDAIPSGQQTFEDVPPSHPLWLYVERLAEPGRGYISGYTCGQAPAGSCVPPLDRPYFLPANNLTRGQLAKIDTNAAGYADPVPSTEQTFADVPFGSPFWIYVERASLHAVISGYSTSPPCPGGVPCFLPGNAVTRGQTAKIVANTFYPSCYTPGPTPTATNTPTATRTATNTPTYTPTTPATNTPAPPTPAPQCGPGAGYVITADVSDPTPPQHANVTVYGTLCNNGVPVVGAPMHTTWYYRTTTVTCDGVTGSDGVASCTRNIANASIGYFVEIDVDITVGGQTYTTYTGFTPR